MIFVFHTKFEYSDGQFLEVTNSRFNNYIYFENYNRFVRNKSVAEGLLGFLMQAGSLKRLKRYYHTSSDISNPYFKCCKLICFFTMIVGAT